MTKWLPSSVERGVSSLTVFPCGRTRKSQHILRADSGETHADTRMQTASTGRSKISFGPFRVG